MEKIEIKIGGYTVSVNSVEEARALMGMVRSDSTNREDRPANRRGGRPKGSKNQPKARSKGTKGNRWTVEEVQYIADNLDTGGLKSIARAAILRERHTKGGILMMGWKVKHNPVKIKLTPECQAVVDRYQETKRNAQLV